jgi:hypothetical protein
MKSKKLNMRYDSLCFHIMQGGIRRTEKQECIENHQMSVNRRLPCKILLRVAVSVLTDDNMWNEEGRTI